MNVRCEFSIALYIVGYRRGAAYTRAITVQKKQPLREVDDDVHSTLKNIAIVFVRRCELCENEFCGRVNGAVYIESCGNIRRCAPLRIALAAVRPPSSYGHSSRKLLGESQEMGRATPPINLSVALRHQH